MSQASRQPPASAAPASTARKPSERTLVFIVVFLGLLIVAGIIAVVLRIIYLSSQPAAQQASQTSKIEEATSKGTPLTLPAGAVVKSVSLAGDRMAVHFEAPGEEAGIAVVDISTGAIIRQIDIMRQSPEP